MLAPRPQSSIEKFAADIRFGLSQPQKQTLPEYLYDDVGSALFEAITYLPEYGLTAADTRLLMSRADEIVRLAGSPRTVVELGSGSGKKTRAILDAAARNGAVLYHPIDLSESALDNCSRAMSAAAMVEPVTASYLEGLDLVRSTLPRGAPMLVLFLGSTIGNFEPSEALEFLACVRRRLRDGDSLLLGADLVKPVLDLIVAYDDPAGVTAAFNRNLLARINRELGGNFHLADFMHEARYETDSPRIEMHLLSLRRQTVHIPLAHMTCHFEEGETILTEKSHKFTPEGLRDLTEDAGFRTVAQWVDRIWPFAETLLVPA